MRNVNLEIQHVKGHQDETGKALSREEKFNVIADELASLELQENYTAEPSNHIRNGPTLEIDGRVITSNLAKELRKAAEKEEFENWMRIDKMKLNEREFQKINHEAFGIAISKMDQNTHRLAMRYCYRWLPSGARKHMNDPKEEHRCILCSQIREESSHFLRCRNDIAERAFKKMLEKILFVMIEIGTPPEMWSIIIRNIKSWREGKASEKVICGLQEKIGWGEFLHGRITREITGRLIPNESEAENVERKLAKFIVTVIKAAKASWSERCDAHAIETGCRVQINRKMRLLRRIETLRKELVAVGLGHLQKHEISEIAKWKCEDMQIWLKNNEKLVKKRKMDAGQRTIMQWCISTANS